MIQILGLAAGACTSVAAAPQLYKAWKTKNVKDISIKMFILYVIGGSLWFAYGLLKSDMPIIATNAIALIINAAMLLLKLRYKNHETEEDTGLDPQLSSSRI